MKRKEEDKKSINLFYCSAILFYLASIMYFIAGNNNSIGFLWLGLGSTFLCLGSVNSIKSEKNKDTKDQK